MRPRFVILLLLLLLPSAFAVYAAENQQDAEIKQFPVEGNALLDVLSRSPKLANENPAKKISLQLLNSDKENKGDANQERKDERPSFLS